MEDLVNDERKWCENQHGIVDSLLEPICYCTLIVSIGPYLSKYYFVITIVTLILVVLALHLKRERCAKKSLQEQFFIRPGRGKTLIVRNKAIGVPGKSQEDLARFHNGFRRENYASEKRSSTRNRLYKLKGHKLFRTMPS
eukprot:TCONS_00060123-protein